MQQEKKNIIALIIPSLPVGGMERVVTELANYYAANNMAEVHLVKLTSGKNYFELDAGVKIYSPSFKHTQYNPLVRSLKTGFYLRKTLKKINPRAVLSFGDRYNAFVILFTLGTGRKVYVSNRMNPFLSNGKFIDWFNKRLYPFAKGIVAQTATAATVFAKKYNHGNIKVIGNPIRMVNQNEYIRRENIILNIGRFADQKNQELLVQYFSDLNVKDWKLIFLGDGPGMKKVMALADSLQLNNSVIFAGSVANTDEYYNKSKIFSFTSTSEGFPNALGEALSVPLACISFDCVTGPSDLIQDGINGFLVTDFDHDTYKKKLLQLMQDEALRKRLQQAAEKSIRQFRIENIGQQYLDFILTD